MTIIETEVYTVDEAAKLLKVNKKTIYQLQLENRLSKRRFGRGFKFLGKELLKLFK